MPMKIRQAISPLLNVKVQIGCRKSICKMFISWSVSVTMGSRNRLPCMPPGKISTPAFTAAMPSPIGIITSGSSTPLRPR